MDILLILNDPACEADHSFNGRRLAYTFARRDDVTAHTAIVLGGGAARDPPC
jgi:hypothetical protein